jgi:hypothetical protein
MNYREKQTQDTLEQLDLKIDEVEELIRELPLRMSVKEAMVNKLYDMWSEIEDNLDVSPADFE